ncbi:MAG: hypothetical protein E7649_00515 [Ruminococcaceae bacterium]|nr:hypothetical protein [Oscillospiraceae bacterium]
MGIILFLFGSVTVSADYTSATTLLNICMYYGIAYSHLKTFPDRVSVQFRYSEFRRFERLAREKSVEYSVEKKQGIPYILSRYKHRYGIAFGMICAVFLIIMAHRYVWSVEVIGNETLTTLEVKEMLREQGFGVGSLINQANTDRIENKIMIDSDRVSWMSINIVGTVAEVQIREYSKAPEKEDVTKPANLIAKKAGMVEEVRLFRGNAVVSAGRYVEKGELLVSGLFDSQQIGFRYTRAAGAVMARTEEEFYVEIPYEYEKKVYSGYEYCEKYLNFFDFSMNISKKYGKEGALYDKIDIVEDCDLVGGIKTPLSVRTVKYMEYEYVKETRSEEQAQILAYFELSQLLGEMASDRIVVRKTVTPIIRDDRYMLLCTIVSIENIAEVSEFEVDLTE